MEGAREVTEPLTLIVHWDVGRTSPNAIRRMIWQERHRVTEAARTAAVLAWRAAGCPTVSHPVSVHLTIRRRRKLDPDSALAACKPVIDGLFVEAITPDDSEKWVRYSGVVQMNDYHLPPRCETVTVTIRPRETATASGGGCAALLEEIEGES